MFFFPVRVAVTKIATNAGGGVGDPTYMSPERNLFSHSGKPSKKTDSRTTLWAANHSRVTTSRTGRQHASETAHQHLLWRCSWHPDYWICTETLHQHLRVILSNTSQLVGGNVAICFHFGFKISHRYIKAYFIHTHVTVDVRLSWQRNGVRGKGGEWYLCENIFMKPSLCTMNLYQQNTLNKISLTQGYR